MAKFIATSGFKNTFVAEIEGALHPDHIHKGAIFSIGVDAQGNDIPMDKMGKDDKQLAKRFGKEWALIANLNLCGRIADSTNKDVVAKIQKEVADEAASKKREADVLAAMKANSADLIARLTDAFKLAKA
jgi:hypothetical protein